VAGFCVGGKEKPTELASGIVAMGARVYDPYTGTFTQTDPIQGGGATAYGYTNGDPVNETDLSGDCGFPIGCLAAAGGAILHAGEDAGSGLLDGVKGASGALLDVGARGFAAFAILKPLIFPTNLNAAPCEMHNDCGTVFAKGQPNNGDQQAAIDLANDAQRRGGLSQDDAQTLVDWGNEVGLDSRGPETSDHGSLAGVPHIHVGPVNHIPVH
jgi:RHS repeat-associated protein